MILSSKIKFVDQNKNKMDTLRLVQSEYIKAMNFYLDLYWSHFRLDHYDFKKDALRQWSFYPKLPGIEAIDTPLSARLLKAAQTQVMSKIKSRTAELNKLYYALGKEQTKKKRDVSKIKSLQRCIQIERNRFSKPTISDNDSMELASTCFRIVDNETKTYDYVFDLGPIWDKNHKKANNLKNHICFVAKSHRHDQKLRRLGKEKKSFLVSTSGCQIRYDIPEPQIKQTGTIAGIDQGITNCITLVDMNGNVQQPKFCNHGHELKSILMKMKKRKKGSKNFRQSQDHRTNYVNWCINQLDLTGIQEIRLENLYDIGRGVNSGRLLKSFPYRAIHRKLSQVCKESGVRFIPQSNRYRSQRCSCCGFVFKDNRRGDVFECQSCSHKEQADTNAAKNHLANISPLLDYVPEAKTTGFYWNQ